MKLRKVDDRDSGEAGEGIFDLLMVTWTTTTRRAAM
jgi:hypothetical protein